MNVTDINVRNICRDPETGAIQAVLLLDTCSGRVSVSVSARASADPCEELWSDALRQLQRLPEYRRSPERITLAEHALDSLRADL